MGDFNIDFLRPAECRAFNTILNAFDLVQFVDQPTRYGGTRNSCIDLLIACKTNKTVLQNLVIAPPFARDHCSVVGEFGKRNRRPCQYKTQWLYREANYDALSTAILNTDWHFIDDSNLDIDSTAIKFSDVLNSLLSAYIPTTTYILTFWTLV